ncbi:hypothetical protein XENTR_v10017950 [Xenopus tropicalis]|nr:hypothetical protein XENTR_v10017950 [Xenopus tropicalis]
MGMIKFESLQTFRCMNGKSHELWRKKQWPKSSVTILDIPYFDSQPRPAAM